MIFENTTRWETADLRAYLDRALALANADGQPIAVQCDTVILVKHSSMRSDLARGTTAGRHRTNTVTLRLVTPERAGVDVVSALGAVVSGGWVMPARMQKELWEACLNLVRLRSWTFSANLATPTDLPGVRVMAKRGKSPVALERQLKQARKDRDRARDGLVTAESQVAKLEIKLAKARE